jgi:hypothetical protein
MSTVATKFTLDAGDVDFYTYEMCSVAEFPQQAIIVHNAQQKAATVKVYDDQYKTWQLTISDEYADTWDKIQDVIDENDEMRFYPHREYSETTHYNAILLPDEIKKVYTFGEREALLKVTLNLLESEIDMVQMTELDFFTLLPNPAFFGRATTAAVTLDADGEKYSSIVTVWTAGTITKVHFYTGTVTTGDTMKVSLQSLDASGNPSGTILATSTGNKAYGTVVVDNADDSAWKEVTLTESVALTVGQQVAIVIEYNSYVAGNMTFVPTFMYMSVPGNYYVDSYATGAWTKGAYGARMILEYSDGFYPVVGNQGINGSVAVKGGTAITEAGNKIKFDAGFRCSGFWVNADNDVDTELVLYDVDNNVLANGSNSSSARSSTTYSVVYVPFDGTPASYVDIEAGEYYRVVIKNTNTGTHIGLPIDTFPSAAARSSISNGANTTYTQRQTGAWTETDTNIAAIGLLASGFLKRL